VPHAELIPSPALHDLFQEHPIRFLLGIGFVALILRSHWFLAPIGFALIYGGVGFARAVRQQSNYRKRENLRLRLQGEYETARRYWEDHRPLTIINRARDPLTKAWSYMRPDASAYLGIGRENLALVMTARNRSIVILGPSQGGKSTGINIPMLLTHRGPAVSTSTKRDVLEATYGARSRSGRIWIFDPSGEADPDELPDGVTWLRWSPLWSARRWDDAKMTASAMIGATPAGAENKNPASVHWTICAERFLAPLMFAAALHPQCSVLDVRTWVNLSDFVTPMTILRAVAGNAEHTAHSGAAIAIEELQSVMNFDPRERSGVISTAQTVTNVYSYESTLRTCVDQNFDPDKFVASRDTVYVAASSRRQAATAPLVAGFIEAIQVATYNHNRLVPFLASNRASVLLALDEVANIAPVKDMPKYLSEGAGQGLQVVAYLQSLAQAQVAWPVQGRSLLDYFNVKVALGGLSDETTLKALSALCGDYDRKYVSHSVGGSTSVTTGLSETVTRPTWTATGGSASKTDSSTTSRSESGSTSTSVRKERKLTEGDIASLAPGTALVIDADKRRTFDLVGTWANPWRSIIAAPTPPVPFREAPRTLIDPGQIALPPVADLVADEQRRLSQDDDDD
jgi:type IV secretion system protein VirD4